MDLALKIRQNAKEYQDAVSDLVNWEKDIKKKEASVTKSSVKIAPPMRGSSTSTKPSTAPSSTVPEPKPQKIKSYDYRSWDKFNVEKALADVDYAVEKPKPSSTDSQPGSVVGPGGVAMEDDVNRIEEALIQKEKGNAYFKKGDYKKALLCYSKSVKLDSSNVIPVVNRAMVYLKLERYKEAEIDCTNALQIQPKNVKALWRRGIARRKLGYLQIGYQDLKTALVLEPSNASIKNEVLDLETDLAKTQKAFPVIEAENAEKKETRRRRVPIEEVGEWKGDKVGVDESIASSMVPPSAEKIEKLVSTQSSKTDKTLPLLEKKIVTETKLEEVPLKKQSLESAARPTTKPVDVLEVTEKKEDPPKTIVSHPHKEQPIGNSKTRVLIEEIPPQPVVNHSYPRPQTPIKTDPASKQTSPNPKLRVPEKPKTMFEFERDWKSLKNDPERLYLYLRNIHGSEYVSLFKSSFESHYMTKMLEIIHDFYIPRESLEETITFLSSLSKVPRFSMVTMFLTRKDKALLKTIFEKVGQFNEEKVDSLRKAYGVK